jgi:hypothetical protein
MSRIFRRYMRSTPGIVPIELSTTRLQICFRCPSLDKEDRRCMECGCAVPTKVLLEDEMCPLEKW